ncbi:YqiA/YcfP family alpha/beta fold hydrolase [Desulfococcaceae bacterium HSG9]|nr:YqiA/YcfP family alpha/beta fold hydrolase [Desulfococcaceae bacterium HSG9]
MSAKSENSITQEITFISDGFRLHGTLSKPDIRRPPVVIGSHGLLSDGDSPKQIRLAQVCSQRNIAFFRFDHRGCGQSQGAFQDVTTLNARCNDLMAAIKIMQSRDDIGDQIGLFGSSLGGAAALSATARHTIAALVITAAPVQSRGIENVSQFPDEFSALPFSFYQKNLQFDISDSLSSAHTTLIFHGDNDTIVPIANAHKILAKAGNPKKLIIQKNGDHRMSNPDDQKNFIRQAVLWFDSHLNPD